MIQLIGRETVEKIASGQVIIELASAVKELVENGLDAGATAIEVTLYNEGVDAFEVVDNGSGIGEEGFQLLGQSHCTSKLTDFDDLDAVQTLGFRGEAFHSLCSLAQSVSVVSRCPDRELGFLVEYKASGLTGKPRPMAASQGTRVKITGLFHDFPVRLLDWKRNSKKAFAKALRVLQSFAIGFPAVKFRCSAIEPGKTAACLLATSGSGLATSVLSEVFGYNSKQLCEVKIQTELALDCSLVVGKSDAPRRPTGDRQFFFVNGHVSDQKTLQKACNEPFREYGIGDFPVLALSLRLGEGEFDVNLTPDKRMITVFKEKELGEELKAAIREALFKKIELTPKIEVPGYSQTLLPQAMMPTKKRAEPRVEVDEVESEDPCERGSVVAHVDASPCCAERVDPIGCLSEPVSDCLCKEDFLAMEVVGQFNCGFILTRLDRGRDSFMYIIDQHASDERFRLETLERSEKMTVQRLMVPKKFSLSPEDALAMTGCLERLSELGFTVQPTEKPDTFDLLTVPHLLNVTLELSDFLEVFARLKDSSGTAGGHALSCSSKVSASLASKACRTAIMIGAPLSFPQMTTVIRNMAGLEKPWICAHGRPTVRLLYTCRSSV